MDDANKHMRKVGILSPNAKQTKLVASTPGAFFHARNRNLSGLNGSNDPQLSNTGDIRSFSFDRYLQAHERISAQAAEQIDKYNKSAIKRVKLSKLNEKYQKEADAQYKYKLGKIKEKTDACTQRR